jgi:hypothetical protein
MLTALSMSSNLEVVDSVRITMRQLVHVIRSHKKRSLGAEAGPFHGLEPTLRMFTQAPHVYTYPIRFCPEP